KTVSEYKLEPRLRGKAPRAKRKIGSIESCARMGLDQSAADVLNLVSVDFNIDTSHVSAMSQAGNLPFNILRAPAGTEVIRVVHRHLKVNEVNGALVLENSHTLCLAAITDRLGGPGAGMLGRLNGLARRANIK
ncbi:MAG: hypothetical protein ACRD2G_03160, partial [Terriglobia bacterium]